MKWRLGRRVLLAMWLEMQDKSAVVLAGRARCFGQGAECSRIICRYREAPWGVIIVE